MKFKELTIQAFEEGNFYGAIKGIGNLYSKNHTWGEHDNLLVFHHLLDWLKNKNNSAYVNKIKEIFKQDFITNREVSKIDQGLESIHLIRSYCIMAQDKQYWPIEHDFFIKLISESIKQFSLNEIEIFNIKRDIELLRKYLPDLN